MSDTVSKGGKVAEVPIDPVEMRKVRAAKRKKIGRWLFLHKWHEGAVKREH